MRGYNEAAKAASAQLPGPFSTLMRGMRMGEKAVHQSLLNLEKVFGDDTVTTEKVVQGLRQFDSNTEQVCVHRNVSKMAGQPHPVQYPARKGTAGRTTSAALQNRHDERQQHEQRQQRQVPYPEEELSSEVKGFRKRANANYPSTKTKKPSGLYEVSGRNTLGRIRLAREIQKHHPHRRVVDGKEVRFFPVKFGLHYPMSDCNT